MHLQPLRIEAGWKIIYNQFYELDPFEGNQDFFEGSSLLMLENRSRLKLIDVQWRPERDLNGEYQLLVLNFLEDFFPNSNEMKINVNWEEPHYQFSTKKRLELVQKIESLMVTLPIYKDPRIILKKGEVSYPSESYRIELLNKGLSSDLIEQVLENGNSEIQNLILDHQNVTQDVIKRFLENGVNKKVKNKAKQKLNSKKFRE